MDHRIKEILAEIEKHISRPFVIRDLAKSVNMSVSHFQHLFKREVQTSAIKYINNLRLEKAGELLVSSHLQVKEIRLQVGVTNEAHFQRNFKRKFGETPNKYRQIYKNGKKRFANSRNG